MFVRCQAASLRDDIARGICASPAAAPPCLCASVRANLTRCQPGQAPFRAIRVGRAFPGGTWDCTIHASPDQQRLAISLPLLSLNGLALTEARRHGAGEEHAGLVTAVDWLAGRAGSLAAR